MGLAVAGTPADRDLDQVGGLEDVRILRLHRKGHALAPNPTTCRLAGRAAEQSLRSEAEAVRIDGEGRAVLEYFVATREAGAAAEGPVPEAVRRQSVFDDAEKVELHVEGFD